MASHKIRSTGEVGVFFVYDHNTLKREEDDLKDAILYFYPPYVSIDDQCSVCGQLMGVSEFLLSSVSQSAPAIFKLQQETYCLKRVRNYSFVLEGRSTDSSELLKKQLQHIYEGFVFVYGDMDNVKQQYHNNHIGFLAEMKALWDILFPSASCLNVNHVERVFQVLPSVQVNSDLFLQASNILQSSQRRPGVTRGAIFFKQRVLCTQLSPELTRKLILIRPALPCSQVRTDFPLPKGVRLISVFLTEEEYSSINPSHCHSHTQNWHCDSSKFIWGTAPSDPNSSTVQKPASTRGFTKDESNRLSNSRSISGRNSMEIIPEVPSSTLSDIPFVECDSKKSMEDKSNTYKQGISKHLTYIETPIHASSDSVGCRIKHESKSPNQEHEVTVSGEDSETISDLEDEKEQFPNVLETKKNEDYKNTRPVIIADVTVHNSMSGNASSERRTSPPASRANLQEIVRDHDGEASVNQVTLVNDHDSDLQGREYRKDESIENIDGDTVHLGTSTGEVDSARGGNSPEVDIGTTHPREHNSPGVDIGTTHSEYVVSEAEETANESVYGCSIKSGDESMMSSAENDDKKETMVFRGSNYETAGEESCYEGDDRGGQLQTENCDTVSEDVDISLETPQYSMESHTSTSTLEQHSDSSLSWRPEQHSLHEFTLYIQSHSDVCLLLLLEDEMASDENVLKVLLKSSLPHIAELDYYVKEYLSQSVNEGFLDNYNFLRYDSFFQTVKGNALQPLTSEDEEFQRLAGEMHNDFEENPDMSNMIFRSQAGSCYGNKTINNETFFCLTSLGDKRAEPPPLAKDPVFSLDILAKQKLSKAQNITLL